MGRGLEEIPRWPALADTEMKLNSFTQWLLDRLQEKTSWYAIIGFLASVNIHFNSELTQSIVELAAATASVVAFVTKEKK